MKLRPSIAAVIGLAIAMGACSSSTDSNLLTNDTAPPESAVSWLPCGQIECGQLEVLVDSEEPELGTVKLALYRRVSNQTKNAPTLFMVADRSFGYEPRILAEEASLHFGSAVAGYDIVSIAARGMKDSPMTAGNESRVSTLDVSEDLEDIRTALNLKSVYAMGWGSGATAITTWVMQNPDSVEAAVVDAPKNPTKPLGPQILTQLASSENAALNSVKWCASHLSCVLNAEVADEIGRFKLKMLTGTVPESVTKEVVARAASSAIANNFPGEIFKAMSLAMDGDASLFLSLAGPELTLADAYADCADISAESAARVATAAATLHAKKTRQFHIGTEPTLYALCSQLPPAVRPLGMVKPADDVDEVNVMVTIARGDPIVPPAPARQMAAEMKWTYKSVYANRHLVLGFDPAITNAAMEFLAQ